MDQLHSALKHTPYDGSAKPFTIGLQQLDLNDWIEVDDHLGPYLSEKDRLFSAHPHKVFVEESATRHAQREVLDLLVEHLPQRFPDIYRRHADTMEIVTDSSGNTRHIALHHGVNQPLRTAASLVQEDLLLMSRNEESWRLSAASLSFPSSWSLADKFGRSMNDIHAPVPDFHAGTRNADLINRMFDNLRPDRSVWRINWSLQADGNLYHPIPSVHKNSAYGSGALYDRTFIRIERQTLRKLPVSGDILFTIRIHLNPVDALRRHPDGIRLSGQLAEQIEALDEVKLNYKGLTKIRDDLLAELRSFG